MLKQKAQRATEIGTGIFPMAAEQGYGGQYAQQYQGAQEEYNVVDTSENFPYYFCEKVAEPRDGSEEAVEAADASWDELRDWIRSHTKEEVRAAIEARDYAGYTALHWACQKVPPVDVIDAFISVGPHITGWPDNDELLPIHHAALFGADTSVITSLVEAFPGSKSRTDRRGRTPLHCACEKSYPNSVLVVDLLSFTTSDSDSFENVCVAESVDVSGQLPIHVACSIGANPQVIQSLVEAFPESTTKTDNRGQTPLHCACQVSSPVSPVLVALLSSTGAAGYADESNGCLVSWSDTLRSFRWVERTFLTYLRISRCSLSIMPVPLVLPRKRFTFWRTRIKKVLRAWIKTDVLLSIMFW